MKFKNPLMREFIDKDFKDGPKVKGFEKKCSDFIKFLDSLPKYIEREMLSLKDWEKLFLEDHEKANEIIVNENNENIKFIWLISSFKIYKLLKATLKLLDEKNFYSAIPLIRAMTEVCCFCYYCLSQIKPLMIEVNQNVYDYYAYNLWNMEIEKILQIALKGTRSHVMLREDEDTRKTTRIGEVIKYVSKKRKYKLIAKVYGILCEYAHPNVFSNSIFGVLTRYYKKKDIKFLDSEGIAVIPGETDKYYRDLPRKHSKMVITFLPFLFSIIDMNMDLFRETVMDFKDMKIDLIKAEHPSSFLIKSLSNEEKKKLLEERKMGRFSNEK